MSDDPVSQLLGMSGKTSADAVFPIPLPLKESSCVAAAYYDVFTGRLDITFHDESEADYVVDIATILMWLRAKSVGGFFNSRIKGQ
jgi:hypothetical protein